MKAFSLTRRALPVLTAIALATGVSLAPVPAAAQITAFKQAVAEAASRDDAVAAFYRENGYQPIWTGTDQADRDRRAALLRAITQAHAHGLPVARYDPDALIAQLRAVRSTRDRGLVEVAMTRIFLQYARDIQTGVINDPKSIDREIVRDIAYRDPATHLERITSEKPAAVFRSLPPRSMEYNALLKEKVEMEALLKAGGWGPVVNAARLEPGDRGQAVVALRDRLIAMGFLKRSNTMTYDTAIAGAVQAFQLAHGLKEDGTAGSETMKQINVGVRERLQSVMVALERERWFNSDRGKRHILVNIPDFSAKIMDDGKVTFYTRAVVGARNNDKSTPEFSDVMEHMVVNPSWYVPRTIIARDYLPAMKRNRNAASYLVITDSRGRRVPRSAINFNAYSARSFPFAMHQPPSRSNALGLVKFMFPNKHAIYLHDTPSKYLFERDVRDYSSGCIRLQKPFEFAYALLAKQTDDPVGTFKRALNSGGERKIVLETPVPVHLIYRTAVTNARGHTEYRADIYGRDAKIWSALSRAGVALDGFQG